MDSIRIRFTAQPVRHTSPAAQSIYQVIDRGGIYRTADLTLSTYRLDPGATATVTIETSMEATDGYGWGVLGQFGEDNSGSNKYQRLTFVGALRYLSAASSTPMGLWSSTFPTMLA